MEITFLGTSAMVPTKERNQSSFLLEYKGRGILFDVGEGTQRQLRIIGKSPSKVNIILISHWHGDHSLGLIGLLQTLSSQNIEHKITIIGPENTKKNIELLMDIFPSNFSFEYEVLEAEDNIFDFGSFEIHTKVLCHNVKSLGFSFVEKDVLKIKEEKIKEEKIKPGPWLGKLQKGLDSEYEGRILKVEDYTFVVKGRKITYISDTQLCDSVFEIAKDSNVIISESTFTRQHEDKSVLYKHLTSSQAALVALKSNADLLILTHFSQRYSDLNDMLFEAKEVFENTRLAFDFMKVKL